MKSVLTILAAALASAPLSATEIEVHLRRGPEGEERCTLRADNAPVDLVLEAIAERLADLHEGRPTAVEGFGPETRAALVTVDLRDRPLDFVLAATAGSIGLEVERRPGALRVRTESSDAMDPADLASEAMLAYASATRRFPAHTAAPRARLAQGRLEEERENLSAALGHYETVRDTYRESSAVPEAMWRMGLVLERMGNWSEANLTFRALANLPAADDHHARARLETARCAAALGDPYRAIHVLEALDETHPATSHDERVDRRLVAARALVDAGRPMEALRSLEHVVAGKLTEDQRTEVFGLQARAFEDVELVPEAAWAWQVYSRHVEGSERATALENAARLSLDADEELNVLFLERLAAEDGVADRLEPYVAEAKKRLGMSPGVGARRTPPLETVRRAEDLLAAEDVAGASRLLEPLFAERSDLEPEVLVRLTTTWARVLERRRGLDAALRMLRGVRPTLDDLEHRRRLDVCAASLFEEYELFEQAVRAYEGRY